VPPRNRFNKIKPDKLAGSERVASHTRTTGKPRGQCAAEAAAKTLSPWCARGQRAWAG